MTSNTRAETPCVCVLFVRRPDSQRACVQRRRPQTASSCRHFTGRRKLAAVERLAGVASDSVRACICSPAFLHCKHIHLSAWRVTALDKSELNNKYKKKETSHLVLDNEENKSTLLQLGLMLFPSPFATFQHDTLVLET